MTLRGKTAPRPRPAPGSAACVHETQTPQSQASAVAYTPGLTVTQPDGRVLTFNLPGVSGAPWYVRPETHKRHLWHSIDSPQGIALTREAQPAPPLTKSPAREWHPGCLSYNTLFCVQGNDWHRCGLAPHVIGAHTCHFCQVQW
jgi:hypothetical protein